MCAGSCIRGVADAPRGLQPLVCTKPCVSQRERWLGGGVAEDLLFGLGCDFNFRLGLVLGLGFSHPLDPLFTGDLLSPPCQLINVNSFSWKVRGSILLFFYCFAIDEDSLFLIWPPGRLLRRAFSLRRALGIVNVGLHLKNAKNKRLILIYISIYLICVFLNHIKRIYIFYMP